MGHAWDGLRTWFRCSGRKRFTVIVECEAMGDQLFGMDLAIFDHLGGNSEGRTASIGANWPGFHAMTKSTGEVNFLVPDRGGVDAQGEQADGSRSYDEYVLAWLWETAQDGMYGDSGGFKQDCLFITHCWWDAEELLLVQQHLLAPATTNRLRARKRASTFT